MRAGPRTAQTRAIFTFIRDNGPVPQQKLVARFASEAAAVGVSITTWLMRRLDAMVAARFVQHGPGGWTAAEDVEIRGEPVEHRGGGRPAKSEERRDSGRPAKQATPASGSIAEPRRVSMFGPTYVPPLLPHRAGAQDHAAHPSVINGAPRAYWGAR